MTQYVLFFIHLESRRVCLAGSIRTRPGWSKWRRNATGESRGNLERRRYALHDRDTKFCDSFRATLTSGGIRPIQLPARSPNLGFRGEMGALGETGVPVETYLVRRSLAATCAQRTPNEVTKGKGNVLLFPSEEGRRRRSVCCRERLGGLLRYYGRAA